MRTARIKVNADEGDAIYHCMTRTINGERLLDDVAKEVLRRQLWQAADYCGVELLTYTILSNHFHVLVRVPQRMDVSDAEVLRRYRVMYPKPTKYQAMRLEVIVAQLERQEPEALEWRDRQLELMGDVSQFMKLVKQRFSVWFNRSHKRYGTLWSERFKSVLVEGSPNVLQTMAAYIDLNCVRAGLVSDPKDYRFCGYAEAVAGSAQARCGLARVVESKSWEQRQAAYRLTLFGTAAGPRAMGVTLTEHDLAKVAKTKGKLPLPTVLRCRLRYFSDGAVLGSKAFVETHLATYREQTGQRERTRPREIPNVTDWGDLNTLRGLRSNRV